MSEQDSQLCGEPKRVGILPYPVKLAAPPITYFWSSLQIDVGAVQELIELARGPSGVSGNSNDMRSKAYQTLGQLCFNNKSTGIQLGEDQDYLQVISQTLKDNTASKVRGHHESNQIKPVSKYCASGTHAGRA